MIAVAAQAAGKTEECFTYRKAQDYSRAIQAGRDAIRTTPQDGAAHYCLGVSFMDQGDFDNTQHSLQQAERLFTNKGDLASVYAFLGQVADKKGDQQQALNYYSRQLELARDVRDRADESAALSNIAGVFRNRGDLDKALDYYQQSLSLEPMEANKATMYNNIAMVYSDNTTQRRRPARQARRLCFCRNRSATSNFRSSLRPSTAICAIR